MPFAKWLSYRNEHEVFATRASVFEVRARRLLRPFRLRGPLAADPTAQMLHALLVIIAVWMATGFIMTLNLGPVTLTRLALPLALQSSLAAALILLHLGQFRRASL